MQLLQESRGCEARLSRPVPAGSQTASRASAQKRSRMDDASRCVPHLGSLRGQHLSQQVLLYLRQAPGQSFPERLSASRACRSANDTSRSPAAHPSTSRSMCVSASSLTATSAVALRNSLVSCPVNRRSCRRTLVDAVGGSEGSAGRTADPAEWQRPSGTVPEGARGSGASDRARATEGRSGGSRRARWNTARPCASRSLSR